MKVILTTNRIRHILINCFSFVSNRKNEILLESFPDYSCNTYELCRCMIQNRVYEKYKIVWLLHDGEHVPNEWNGLIDSFEMSPNSFIGRIKSYKRRYNARAIISCNSFFPKYTGHKNQLRFYLDHSSQLKDMRINCRKIDLGCDYYFSQSRFFVPYHLQQYDIANDQIVCLGMPRMDQFYKKLPDVSLLINDIDRFKKVIIWAPTFRQHYKGNRIDCDVEYPFGVPVINTSDDLNSLIDLLESKNILMLIKPHPAQDVSKLKIHNSKNLRLVYSEDLINGKIQVDELLGYTDALITDYSSIYYDYLELKKPIAITLDDYESYKSQKGFVFDDMLTYIKGDYVYTIKDLLEFIERVSNDEDYSLDEREKIREMINDYQDGNNSKRVMDFILEKIDNQKGKYK